MDGEILGFKKIISELYSVKVKEIVFFDSNNNITGTKTVWGDIFKNIKNNATIQIYEMGISIRKPENKSIFPIKHDAKIYYSYDITDEIIDNINDYNKKLSEWNNRNSMQKLKDYNEDKVFNYKPLKEIIVEPCEMMYSELSQIDQDIHDESLTLTKIQSLSHKKKGAFNLGLNNDMLIYGLVGIAFIVLLAYLLYTHQGTLRL